MSKYFCVQVNFHVFSVSGDFFWKDGEYFARKVSDVTIPT